jgi:uncharacterized coiled-coil protein SlyX
MALWLHTKPLDEEGTDMSLQTLYLRKRDATERCPGSLLDIADRYIAELQARVAELEAITSSMGDDLCSLTGVHERLEKVTENWKAAKADADAMQLDRQRMREMQADLTALMDRLDDSGIGTPAVISIRWRDA